MSGGVGTTGMLPSRCVYGCDHLSAEQDRVLADVGASKKIYGYYCSFNGFTADLPPKQVTALRKHRDVVRGWKDELLHPQTDNTPRYLGLSIQGGLWSHKLTGENIIVTFSSRGPNGGSPDIIKPDVTAAGVQILAGQTPTPNEGQAPGVRSNLAARPLPASFPAEVFESAATADGSTSFDVSAGVSGDFATSAGGLVAAEIQSHSVAGGDATLHFFFAPPGTRLARISLFDESVGDGSGSDDLDLQIQGPGAADSGDVVPVQIDWSGRTPATKYRGPVEISRNGGELGFTVISIDTAP